MKDYLTKSLASKRAEDGQLANSNKIKGLLAEIEFREYLEELGFIQHVSIGGWIVRNALQPGKIDFGEHNLALFPEMVTSDDRYNSGRILPAPKQGLHSVSSLLHQIGVRSFFCSPEFSDEDNVETVKWNLMELGLPRETPYISVEEAIENFSLRNRPYNFLRYNTDVSRIPDKHLNEEFTKELLRVSFENKYMSEISDIDGIFWGREKTYPLEIKEKTPANAKKIGDYFGLDLGPFAKLAFYAAKTGNMNSIFVVREIDDIGTRNLVQWWYIPFEILTKYASWTPIGGGTNMISGGSTVVPVPKSRFKALNKEALDKL